MIALFVFYSLGRKSEIMNLTVGDTLLLESENRILVDISRKKTGREQKYYVPGGDFDLKSAFKAHLEALEKLFIIWLRNARMDLQYSPAFVSNTGILFLN